MRNLLLLLLLGTITLGGEGVAAGRAVSRLLPHEYQARSIEFVHKLVTAADAEWFFSSHFQKLKDHIKGHDTLTVDAMEEIQALVRGDIVESGKKSPFLEMFSEQDLSKLTGEEIDRLIENKINPRLEDTFANLKEDVKLERAAEEEYQNLPYPEYQEILQRKNDAIRALDSDDRLYLYQLTLTLADERKVTISKAGKSSVGNITMRVGRQIVQMQTFAALIEAQGSKLKANPELADKDLITFQLSKDEEAVPVIKMEVKTIFTGKDTVKEESKRAKILPNGIQDKDIHSHLIEEYGYHRVSGIPNLNGGMREELLIHISKGADKQRDDIERAFAAVTKENYLSRRAKTNAKTNGYNGVSLHLPQTNLAEVTLAGIYTNAGISGKLASITKQKLAKADMEIRWLKHKKIISGEVAQKVAEMWRHKLKQLIKEEGLSEKGLSEKEVENLSAEVYLMRVLLDGIDRWASDAARQLGHTGKGNYTYVGHIDGKITFDEARLTEMRAFTLLRFGEDKERLQAFDTFMNHVAQTKNLDMAKITKDAKKLQDIITTSIRIKELDAFLEGDSRRGDFTQLLTKAVLEDRPAELIKEVLLMRVLLDGIDGKLAQAARQFGHTGSPDYTYAGHINGKITFDVARLTEMRAFTLLRFGEDKRQAFDAFMEHVVQTENLNTEEITKKITEDAKKLQDIITTSIRIKELDAFLEGDSRRGDFTQLLTKAVLEDRPAELIKEVLLMRVLLDGIDGNVRNAARQFGFTGNPNYSYVGHIDRKITFDEARLTQMRAFTLLRFGEDKRQAFDAFMEHVVQTENLNTEEITKKITEAAKKLQEIINDESIGIKEFDRLIAGAKNSGTSSFISLLTKAVLEGRPAELIKEVLLMRLLLDGIDGKVQDAAQQLGFTGGLSYSYVRHMDGAFTFDEARLTEMRAFTLLRFGEKEKVVGAFDAFMEHVVQTNNLYMEKITADAEKLQEVINDESIGIKEFDRLIAGAKNNGRATFTSLLTKAVLEGRPAELIKEVLLMRVLLDGIDGNVRNAARQFGFTGNPNYSYVGHIDRKITFDEARLTQMRAFTLLRFGEDKERLQAFDTFMEHVVQTKNLAMKKITKDANELQEVINDESIGGIKEFDRLIAGKNTGKNPFTQLLTEAVLEDRPDKLIKEVLLMRVLTSAMQTLTGEKKKAQTIARSLGVKGKYSFKAHLGVGHVDMEKAEAISNGFSTEISQALNEMEKYVNELTAAWQGSEDNSLQQEAVVDMQAALQELKKLHPSEGVIATEKYEQMKMFDLEEAAGF